MVYFDRGNLFDDLRSGHGGESNSQNIRGRHVDGGSANQSVGGYSGPMSIYGGLCNGFEAPGARHLGDNGGTDGQNKANCQVAKANCRWQSLADSGSRT